MNRTQNRVTSDQSYWLWVTRPEFYRDKDGKDRDLLEPEETGLWWTCHKDTRRGDLALLWLTNPRSDIGYLFQAKSDSYDISDDRDAVRRGWTYACDCITVFKFVQPLSLSEIQRLPYLDEWNALRANFRGMSFRFEPQIWERVNRLLMGSNRDYRPVLRQLSGYISPKIQAEEELEENLSLHLGVLRRFGYDLELWHDRDTNQSGRQYVLKGHGGRIDLLCSERKGRGFVVIELKNVRAAAMTFAQISSYMGWVADRLAGRRSVRGLVISRGYDANFKASMDLLSGSKHPVNQIDLSDLGFE